MFKARGQALGCSKCPHRRIWEHASDWLNSFVMEDKKQKKRLGSRSTWLRLELCTSACETYMMQFLLKIFRSVLNLLSAELPDSRGIFVRLESQTV